MVHTLTCNAFGEQTYVVEHGDGGLTVVDPGMASGEERKTFQDLCHRLDAKPVQVLLTHAHLDHVMGCAWMMDTYGLAPRLHPADRETYGQAPRVAEVYGVRMDPVPLAAFDLAHGDTVACGQVGLEVRFVPGHAPGHVAFVCHSGGWTLGGDVCSEAVWDEPTCQAATPWPSPRASKPKSSPCPIPWWCGQVTAGPRRWGMKSRETPL